MRLRRQSLLSHGLSPYKKAKEQIFLREQAPDKICFSLFLHGLWLSEIYA